MAQNYRDRDPIGSGLVLAALLLLSACAPTGSD